MVILCIPVINGQAGFAGFHLVNQEHAQAAFRCQVL
jgi:hypothetical protein